MEFKKRYEALNAAQREAVDAIDGPIMVVAGPGTGKTELLSVRVANILQTSDTLPHNILCMTFTESGAAAMRERLAGLIGPDAYKVAIHTFHSFGSEIINRYGQYFYHGAHFRPADELSSYEILSGLLENLPHKNPLASTMNGEFTHLRDIQSAISDLKKSGLTPDEFGLILDRNEQFFEWIRPHLITVFSDRLSKKSIPLAQTLLHDIDSYDGEPLELVGYRPMHDIVQQTLQAGIDEATKQNSTKPLSAWKKAFIQKDAHGDHVLRDSLRAEKLRALTSVYYDYLVAMQTAELYDYDDMILRVVHAMEVFNELRFDLQETYQYILVDEFQDTNDAQMRLLWNLTNNEASAGRPNIMVVGDDDQAIYRFQGANISNIIDFTSRYRDVHVVTLRDNYRSSGAILGIARSVIVQGDERLETTLSIDKTLTPHHSAPDTPSLHSYVSTHESRTSLAEAINARYRHNSSQSIAVIARNHRQLIALLPHLQSRDIPLRYEHQDDVLQSEPVMQLELLGRVVNAIALQHFDEANAYLPQLLAHPAWALSSKDIWQLSISAYQNSTFWLEEMLTREGKLQQIAEWLIVASHYAKTEPLEYMCDYLFGIIDQQSADTASEEYSDDQTSEHEEFISPYRAYFFPADSLETTPGKYLVYLAALQKIRSSLREFRSDRVIMLSDLIDFLDMHHEMNLAIRGTTTIENDESAVTLLTAHKSKGLEFDHVYITDALESIWGASARSRARLIQFPANVPIAPAGDSDDERLRLLYVALTRAKDSLSLYAGRSDDNGKELLPVGSIPTDALAPTIHDMLPPSDLITAVTNDWRTPLLDVKTATKDQLLRPLLDRYKLSATHLNNFLDVSRGGPQLFLLHNLLRFPQAMSPSAAYGSAIHKTLQRAHAHMISTGKRRPIEDVLHDYEELLGQYQLSELETAKQLQRGTTVLSEFLRQRYDSFTPTQLVEQSFASESVLIDDALITGAIDLIDIDTDEKTIFITDYKTGKAVRNWRGSTEYEKIKLHHYEQQLMMYKLLIENSRQFSGYTVTGGRIEFVEPDQKNEIVYLDYDYDDTKMTEFRRLINAVWQRIQSLNFDGHPDYTLDYQGILDFERDVMS